MTISLTTDQIQELAPDRASLQAGQKLARSHIWQSLGSTETWLWGECQGSAATPYRTQIDLSREPAWRCSCPSRKLPCKHALALLLLAANEPQQLAPAEPPEWAAAWFASRAAKQFEKSEASAEILAQKAHKHTSSTSNRRATTREDRVASGIQDAQRWLADVIRQGLANAQQQPASFWENTAARMIDAQAPGIARMIRAVPGLLASGRGWQDRVLEHFGRLHLLMESYARLEHLPEPTQADIRTAIGWTHNREELAQQTGLHDTWQVIGRRVSEDDANMRTQRTWLFGRTTQRFALQLDFAPAHQPLPRNFVPGTQFEASLVFYPGAAPLRALITEQHAPPERLVRVPGFPLAAEIARYAEALGRNPWIEQFPLLPGQVVPVQHGDAWLLCDAEGRGLPIAARFAHCWPLLAISGGLPITVAGEWDGEAFLPLGAWAEGLWTNF